jgi:hypothetical protein
MLERGLVDGSVKEVRITRGVLVFDREFLRSEIVDIS